MDTLFSNKINPHAVVILNPGNGFGGDNWTIFKDKDYRLYQSLLYNNKQNNTPMPKYLLTNTVFNDKCFWPNFRIAERYSRSGYRLFTEYHNREKK